VGVWAFLFLAGCLLFTAALDLHADDGGWQTFTLALLVFLLALFLVAYVSYNNWGVSRARDGLRAELRAMDELGGLGDAYHVYTNYRPPGWDSDIDLLVVGPGKLCLVEVKSDPGRITATGGRLESHRAAGTIDLTPQLCRTRRRARRLRQHLITLAAERRIPSGIPPIPSLTAFAARGHVRGVAGACHIKDLAHLIVQQPPNLSAPQCDALRTVLEAAP
jgi:hypothetical protein